MLTLIHVAPVVVDYDAAVAAPWAQIFYSKRDDLEAAKWTLFHHCSPSSTACLTSELDAIMDNAAALVVYFPSWRARWWTRACSIGWHIMMYAKSLLGDVSSIFLLSTIETTKSCYVLVIRDRRPLNWTWRRGRDQCIIIISGRGQLHETWCWG